MEIDKCDRLSIKNTDIFNSHELDDVIQKTLKCEKF